MLLVAALAAALLLGACGPGPSPLDRLRDDGGAVPAALDPAALDAAGIPRLRPEVLATLPHDPGAFTQGFEIAGDTLWEGTGRRGRSQLRALDPATGALRRAVDLPPELYGEGVTVLPDRIWQLTWTERRALERDPRTLAVTREVPFDREGWGACGRDRTVVTSDGSDELVTRDPVTLVPLGGVRVTAAGRPVTALNELECTPDGIWANVWPTDRIVRIDPADGRVTAVVDATGLLPLDRRAGADVLNGVAAVPGTDEYLLTGKLWPTIFRVRLVPG